MKSILICGGGTMQLPAIRIARQEGMYCVVADGNGECPGRAQADRFEQVDLNDLAGMVEAARRNRVDGVFTAGTDFSTTVAWVADTLGLPGIGYDTAVRAKDKAVMRQALHDGGVLVPPFCIYEDGKAVTDSSRVPFPAVVKPVDNMGARGVRIVRSVDEVPSAVEAATAFSRSARVLLESFIPGREYSIDAISYRGSITACGTGDRHIAFPPYFVEIGHTIPSALSDRRMRHLETGFARAVRVLGIDPGAAKGDVFLVPRETAPAWLIERVDSQAAQEASPATATRPSSAADTDDLVVIGEVAARLSGGYMSGWTYPLARGVEPTRAALRIAVGEEPGDLTETTSHYSAERAIISIPGTIERFEGTDELRGAVSELFLTRNPGDEVSLPTSNVEKCGNLIYVDRSYESAASGADELRSRIRVRLKREDHRTEAFLFGTTEPLLTAWDCSVPEQRGNYRSLERRANAKLSDIAAAVDHSGHSGHSHHGPHDASPGNESRSGGPRGEDRSPVSWPAALRKRYESIARYDSSMEGADTQRDIQNRTREDCVSAFEEHLSALEERLTALDRGPRLRGDTHQSEFLVELCTLAIERGGLQGSLYLIDTISETEGFTQLCSRVITLRQADS